MGEKNSYHQDNHLKYEFTFTLLSYGGVCVCVCIYIYIYTHIHSTVLLLFSHCVQLFCDPMDHSSPGSSAHGISQARIVVWVAISFSRGSSQPMSPALAGRFFTTEPQGSPLAHSTKLKKFSE